ncbi:hypothetical protein M5D96_014187, partial [Drosophila gunungcola]
MLSIMSVFTRKIVKSIINANEVRASILREKGLAESVRVAVEEHKFYLVKRITAFLQEAELNDDEFLLIIKDANKIIFNLTKDFVNLVEALLSLNWKNRSFEIIEAYTEFWVDIVVAQNIYLPISISKLIIHWIPGHLDASEWVNGSPSECTRSELKFTHDLLNRILTAVPMAFDEVMNAIIKLYPYFKKPAHVTAGYLFNMLCLIEYKPIFEEQILKLALQKLLVLDVNAPNGKTLDICLFMLF